jgi:hypothetical protein
MSVTACAGSTRQTSLDSNSALLSLAIGLTQSPEADGSSPAETKASFDAIGPRLAKVSVTVDGVPQKMYAFSVRETFPPGTCAEAVFVDPSFPRLPGVCSPLVTGISTFLWQTRSASKAPDKWIRLITDVGTDEFDHSTATFTITSSGRPKTQEPFFPAFASYSAAGKLFGAQSGSITTSMTASGSRCAVPAVPYAKVSRCRFATFAVSGTIVMRDQGTTGKTLSLGIPSIVIDGMWIDNTSMQPITLSSNRVSRSTHGVTPER